MFSPSNVLTTAIDVYILKIMFLNILIGNNKMIVFVLTDLSVT